MSHEKSLKQIKTEDMKDWTDEHGQPSFEYLQSLADDDDPEALDKLRTLAEDLDVEFDDDTTREELVGRIRLATRSETEITT